MSRQGGRRLVPFAYGFRPFFLLGGVYAVVAIAVWLWVYGSGIMPDSRMPPQFWHAHEMIFGFIAAAIAGFLLTAVPSWTGGRGFSGWPLIGLTVVWLAGRAAFAFGDRLNIGFLGAAELVFLPGVILLVAPSLFRGGNRNTRLVPVLLVFWAMDILFLYGIQANNLALSGAALRGALGLVLVLVTVIGGRIVPAFTANAERAARFDGNPRERMTAIGVADEIFVRTFPLHARTEKLIQEGLQRLMEGRTAFVIAHRLSTIVNADRIYVLDQGRVTEIGNHRQLLVKDGLYAALWKVQAGIGA